MYFSTDNIGCWHLFHENAYFTSLLTKKQELLGLPPPGLCYWTVLHGDLRKRQIDACGGGLLRVGVFNSAHLYM